MFEYAKVFFSINFLYITTENITWSRAVIREALDVDGARVYGVYFSLDVVLQLWQCPYACAQVLLWKAGLDNCEEKNEVRVNVRIPSISTSVHMRKNYFSAYIGSSRLDTIMWG